MPADPIAEALARRRRQVELDASAVYDPIEALAETRGNRAVTGTPAPAEGDVWMKSLRRTRVRIDPGEVLARSTIPTYDDSATDLTD